MTIKRALIFSLVLIMGLFSLNLIAQEPPHPPNGGHGINGNQPSGGTARVGDGIAIVIAFALAYSYRRYKRIKKTSFEDVGNSSTE
jgi:hypothetical protein